MAELAGLRALVVEDEGSVALLIEDMLEELGCEVAASVATLAEALTAATDGSFDFAVLDVNLAGELVFPVAEVLRQTAVAVPVQHRIRSDGSAGDVQGLRGVEQALHDGRAGAQALQCLGRAKLNSALPCCSLAIASAWRVSMGLEGVTHFSGRGRRPGCDVD